MPDISDMLYGNSFMLYIVMARTQRPGAYICDFYMPRNISGMVMKSNLKVRIAKFKYICFISVSFKKLNIKNRGREVKLTKPNIDLTFL